MLDRRNVISRIMVATGMIAIAGCSGNSQTDEANEPNGEGQQQTEGQDQEDTTQNNELPNIELNSVEFSYKFSELGLEVRVRNTDERGTDPKQINIAFDAYGGDEVIGSANQWNTIPATYRQDFAIETSGVSKSGENTIDDVSEVIIKAKKKNEDYVELRAISGDELKDRVTD